MKMKSPILKSRHENNKQRLITKKLLIRTKNESISGGLIKKIMIILHIELKTSLLY